MTRPLTLPLLAIVLAACAAPRVRVTSDHDPAAPLATYRTYAWLDTPPAPTSPYPNRAAAGLDWRIRSLVDRDLAAKGYTQRPRDAADFLIGYRVAVKEENTDSFSQYFAYRAAGGTKDLSEAFVRGYEVGTLALAMVEPTSRRIVWRAAAAAQIGPQGTNDALVARAVHDMLAGFPPR